jgi:hypothetical protein
MKRKNRLSLKKNVRHLVVVSLYPRSFRVSPLRTILKLLKKLVIVAIPFIASGKRNQSSWKLSRPK